MPVSLKHLVIDVLEFIYGIAALAVFLVLGTITGVLVLLPVGIAGRRYLTHLMARLLCWCAGVRLRVIDPQHLPTGPCVVVANHASYLDGVVLKAALPARFSFVIKKEVSRVPLAGFLLRRIGSEFVDRFNRHAGGMDARRLIKAADKGQALAFFPEGTFLPEPGIGKFHTGAFAIAGRAGVPIVPIGILGTRHILPSGRYLPRPGRIEVRVLPALPAPQDVAAVAAARDQSRSLIVAALGEPDLAHIDGIAHLQSRRSES